ncbi:comF family protein [Spirosomataceae bacterium TFI 002]|nr:comF family protein [Spirosomataceae bacterium TFI 002]
MQLLKGVLDLLYPRLCGSCGTTLKPTEGQLCISCMVKLPKTNSHTQNIDLLNNKFWGKLNVKNTYSFLKFSKKGLVQELLHNLKYRNKPELAHFMGLWYATDLKEISLDTSIDLIIGVPLHASRLKERGYNQADEFAKGLSEGLGVAFLPDVLLRNISTQTQTKKSRFKRFLNTQYVFEVSDNSIIKGKNIALVDDVLTTGSTLSSCGEILLQNGCNELTIITIASAF